uniref:G-protein coupled receptors family 1 profile domain-containing protein n=1 Tax=Panagrolaimus sp. JU765 TaxID=591449 RepID=A0AC34QT19_9BILA
MSFSSSKTKVESIRVNPNGADNVVLPEPNLGNASMLPSQGRLDSAPLNTSSRFGRSVVEKLLVEQNVSLTNDNTTSNASYCTSSNVNGSQRSGPIGQHFADTRSNVAGLGPQFTAPVCNSCKAEVFKKGRVQHIYKEHFLRQQNRLRYKCPTCSFGAEFKPVVRKHHEEVLYDLTPPNKTVVARLCVSTRDDDFWHFLTINVIIAFVLPFLLIIVCYALIFKTVVEHRSLAVDARIRDERIKLRVAQMMLTVILSFLTCWTPLYALYCYFFLTTNRDTWFFHFASSVLRPAFQWLSLLSSSLNPLIYVAYSQKYRQAFHQLLLLPCQLRMQNFRRETLRGSRNLRTPETRMSLASAQYNFNPRDSQHCLRWSFTKSDRSSGRIPTVYSSNASRHPHYTQHCPGTGHLMNNKTFQNNHGTDF